MSDPRDRWRVTEGRAPHLDRIDTRSSAGTGGKSETAPETASLIVELAELQARLWAESRRSVLLVLQAMDAGGKDGTIRKVFTGVNPQGVRVASFKQPSPEELAHDFLWRIHHRVPAAGEIGVFNRSHYEDVLIVRVDELVKEEVWRKRYGQIREFEELLTENGTTVIKVFLHISKDEQKERFEARLEQPSKRWKFSEADLDVRKKWDRYQDAYAAAIRETSTESCPWYVVPADRKWYRDWAVLQILTRTIADLDPQYPDPPEGLETIDVV